MNTQDPAARRAAFFAAQAKTRKLAENEARKQAAIDAWQAKREQGWERHERVKGAG